MNQRFSHLGQEHAAGCGQQIGEVVEIPLLLPGWQATALETAAHDCGLTAGEMVRHLVRDFIARLPGKKPDGLFAASANGKEY